MKVSAPPQARTAILGLGASALLLGLFITIVPPRIPSSNLFPAGSHYLWDLGLIALAAISNLAVALAYLSIAATIAILLTRNRQRLPLRWALLASTVFVFACGVARTIDVIGLWIPLHRVTLGIRILTGLTAIAAALVLPRLVPQAQSLLAQASTSRSNDQRFRAAMESTLGAFLIAESVRDTSGAVSDLAIVYLNSHAERLLGGQRTLAVGDRLRPILAPTEPSYFDSCKRVVETGKRLHREIDLPFEDQPWRPRWLDVQATRLGDGVAITVNDITRRKIRERQDRVAEFAGFTQSLIQHSPFSVIATDPAGLITAINPATEGLLGYSAAELLHRPMPLHLHGEAELRSFAGKDAEHSGIQQGPEIFARLAQGATGQVRDWTYIHKHGHVVPVSLSVFSARGSDGETLGYFGIAFDAADRKRSDDQIRHLALHDPLTGLPNRSLLQDRLEQAIERANRQGTALAVIMIDLDNFKSINDTCGHEVGDKVLRQLGHRLNTTVRKSDTIARMGGDEFIVLAPDISNDDAAARLAGEILGTLSEPLSIEFHLLTVTASAGVAMLSPTANNAVNLLKHADVAMYNAKERGRNNVVFFDPDMESANERRVQIERALLHALDVEQFSLHFQPLVLVSTGELVGFEALLRLPSPEGGFIPPATFIPQAEESGLIVPIGDWVLRNACLQGRTMQNHLRFDGFRIAINISPRQFQRNGLYASVTRALEASNLPATSLDLEITESVLMLKDADSLDTLRRLRALGVTITIDDFGTGFSSLSYLTQFPIDRIKIDRSFIERAPTDSTCSAITSAILAMSHSLGLEVVAEGVETAEQLAFLTEHNCDIAQGFYFARPQALNPMLEHIKVSFFNGNPRAHLRCFEGEAVRTSAQA